MPKEVGWGNSLISKEIIGCQNFAKRKKNAFFVIELK
jgi:hypothetical protein